MDRDRRHGRRRRDPRRGPPAEEEVGIEGREGGFRRFLGEIRAPPVPSAASARA